jgi:hypothetical protein
VARCGGGRGARPAFIAEDGLMVDADQRGGVRVYGLAIGQHGRRRSVSVCARVRGRNFGRERARERAQGHCPEGVRPKAGVTASLRGSHC